MKSNREKALAWWNELKGTEKVVLMNKSNVEAYRTSESLTGSEIEKIWVAQGLNKDVEIKLNIDSLNESIANALGYDSVKELIENNEHLKDEKDVQEFILNCIDNTLFPPQRQSEMTSLLSMGYKLTK